MKYDNCDVKGVLSVNFLSWYFSIFEISVNVSDCHARDGRELKC